MKGNETADTEGVNAGDIERRLARMESLLAALVERETVKEFYTTDEFAGLVKKAEFTVREWCRHGRLKAPKKASGRGAHASWAIPHEELLRYRRDGLLPPAKR